MNDFSYFKVNQPYLMMSFFRKLLIGKVGFITVILLSFIMAITGIESDNGEKNLILSFVFLLLFLTLGLLEYTQIDLEHGLIRKKIFFYGLSFGAWYAIKDFNYLTIIQSNMHVSNVADLGLRTGSYHITSRFLVLGMHNSDFSIVIKKGGPEELKEIGRKLKGQFPHLELMNSQKRKL